MWSFYSASQIQLCIIWCRPLRGVWLQSYQRFFYIGALYQLSKCPYYLLVPFSWLKSSLSRKGFMRCTPVATRRVQGAGIFLMQTHTQGEMWTHNGRYDEVYGTILNLSTHALPEKFPVSSISIFLSQMWRERRIIHLEIYHRHYFLTCNFVWKMHDFKIPPVCNHFLCISTFAYNSWLKKKRPQNNQQKHLQPHPFIGLYV